jgi:DNA-directed RNA polymerase subunit RPC12/RpoP
VASENRLVVSTQCTTCGAPLDFGEGSNAVGCEYCHSTLLVTGRGRVLSYAVMPQLDGRDAFAIARFAEPAPGTPFRFGEPRLHFLPYYRFRAIELRWQRSDPGPPSVEYYPETREQYAPAISIARVLEDLAPDPEEVELGERHVEKNFLAIDSPLSELYSLGLRTTTLRLSLFGRSELESLGTVVAPDLTVEEATERGESVVDEHRVAYRELLARLLSLVYFPFWVVPVERPGQRTATIVDAVSRAVVVRGASFEGLSSLRTGAGEPQTVGFRPLVCPECGWSLPLRPEDFVFYCSTCFRAWKIVGDSLAPVERGFAAPRDGGAGARKHLPFWELHGRIGDEQTRRYLVPGFRLRRLKILADFATRLARERAPRDEAPVPPSEAHGAFFDERDAAALASFALAAEAGERFDEVDAPPALVVEAARLVWFPFRSEPYSYRETASGLAFPKNLLL